jgi:signal transduction histidine kinase
MDKEQEMLCRVLGSVAVQMRGSMGNIQAALERLVPDELPAGSAAEKNAAILTQSYYRLLRIIDNLSTAPILTEETTIESGDADIVEWLEHLISQARPLVEGQGLTLTFRCAEDYHRVAMHREMMERLLWNLLSNAIKFTDPGGRIDVSLAFRAGLVLLTVADTGCGIPQDMMDTVYDRYMHPERMDPLPHGLGLGLALCRRIAEGHGGRFLLTSRENEGTTVTVALPDDRLGAGLVVEEPMIPSGGFHEALVGLSDALSYRAFLRGRQDL